ncbi:hypothetical protein [Actinomadura sp. 9N407]|uniref:hypothetical protein n=1 Tax=Actinomadura sp. 9N407 TaxID=3375154 RepID=UPI0037952DDF
MVISPGNEEPPRPAEEPPGPAGSPRPDEDAPGATEPAGPDEQPRPAEVPRPAEPREPSGVPRPRFPGSARAPRKGGAARRRRPRRESALVWWAVFAVWAGAAWWQRSWRLALLGLLLWCLYQFLLVPTICRVMTRQGYSCREPVRGRLFACRVEHQRVKNGGLWRVIGMNDPFRRPAEPGSERETGQIVVSPAVRGRLSQIDRTMILLAAAGTLVTIAGMIYGYS